MKKLIYGILLLTTASAIAGTKDYQVTGPILEVTDSKIVVQKGKDKWTIEKDATTKAAADLKVGSKVTIYYTMKATEIESKEKKK